MRRIAFILLLVVIVGLGWEFLALHVDQPAVPTSAADAEAYTGVPLPPEAKNIRVAAYRQWIEYAQYVRFEAPVSVCLKYAAKVAPGSALQPVEIFQRKLDARAPRQGVLDLTWFDLEAATNVVGRLAGPPEADIWIDQDRGVFYFRKTD